MGERTHHDKHASHLLLLERLARQAGDVERLTRGLDESELAQRPEDNKWSIKELVCHLWVIQKLMTGRSRQMLAEDQPSLEGYDPDDDEEFPRLCERPGAWILGEYMAARQEFVELLRPLSPAEWHRGAEHPEFPRYDIHFLAEYLLYHESHHLYQILRLRPRFGKIPH